MRCRRAGLTWLGLVTAVMAVNTSFAQAPPRLPYAQPGSEKMEQLRAAGQVPLEEVPAAVRPSVSLVLNRPTLFTLGPPEIFPCRPAQYYWFLDHPDRVMMAWRRLGAKCLPITDRGGGRFGWCDDQGSDLVWQTIIHGKRLRVWYAEGNVRPAPLLPLISVRAVVLLHHTESKDELGEPIMSHRAEAFLQTDSKAAALLMKMLGSSAPRMAEEGVSQLQLFFAGLSWYLDRHPDHVDWLLLAPVQTEPRQLPWPPTATSRAGKP
jgi:hypothetical protein